MRNRFIIYLVVLSVSIFLFMLGIYFSSDNDGRFEYEIHACENLTKGCQAKMANRTIRLRFPENIGMLKNFPVEVDVFDNGEKLDKVIVSFKMADMDMGLNFFRLQQDEQIKGLWKGDGVLPLCSTGRTDWLAIISVINNNDIKSVAFQFEVEQAKQ